MPAVAGEVVFDAYTTRDSGEDKPDFQPVQQFDCSDRIYTVLEARGLEQTEHELRVDWRDPSGARKELTRFPFKGFSTTRVWAWLQLHGPTTAVVGQIFDPSFGMEDFIGTWRAEVSVNGELVDTVVFEVLC